MKFLKMPSSVCDGELLSSIVSLSHPLSPKPGTVELPHISDRINIEVITTPDPTIEVKPSFSNTPIVNARPTSSALKTPHSPTHPSSNLQITIANATYTVPTKKKIYCT